MIYLDNAATTKPTEKVLRHCEMILREDFYNPSALYYPAIKIKTKIEQARKSVAEKLKCFADEIIFTSGATEANNWAVGCGFKNKKGNLIISAGEHPSVFESAMALKAKGVDVRIAPLNTNGSIDCEKFFELIDDNTAFVSIMHVSNETGATNPVVEIAGRAKKINKKLVFHSDGVQAFCKIPTDIGPTSIDLYSISAHKIGGLKGVGALYISKNLNMASMMLGGGQERRLRSGTENVMGILTFKDAISDFDTDCVKPLFEYIIERLSKIDGIKINSFPENTSGYIISVGISGVKSEVLQHLLCDDGVLVGLGSACSSKTKKNRVLESMKITKDFIDGNIRISLCPQTSIEEIKTAVEIIEKNICKLRSKING